jgi:hypothetical protein
VGQPDLVGHGAAQLTGGLLEDASQDRGQCVGDGHDALAQQQGALVDPPLGVGLEPRGVEPGPAFGVTADEECAVLLAEDGRGHRRRAVHLDDPGRAARPGQHCDGVRRTQVDRQDAHRSPFDETCRKAHRVTSSRT